MKRADLQKTKAKADSDDDTNCMCQAFCADNLSKVGSSDCSCSDCADAMLEAYNEYLNETDKRKENVKQNRAKSATREGRQRKEQTDGANLDDRKTRNANARSTFNKSQRFQAPKQTGQTQKQTCHKEQRHESRTRFRKQLQQQIQPEQQGGDQSDYQPEEIEVSPTKYDYNEAEMLWFVNQRIQENLKKHKHKERDVKREKERELRKRQLALQKLKYQAKIILGQSTLKKTDDKTPGVIKPKKAWNYNPEPVKTIVPPEPPSQVLSLTEEEQVEQDAKKEALLEFIKLQRRKWKERLNQERVKAQTKPKEECKFDKCPDHHMRTQPKKIEEITAKIEKNAEKYLEKVRNEKRAREDAEKLKESKLRALALHAREKLEKSKKIGVNDRSSFHMTIENHSTFSDLRQVNQERLKDKKFEKEIMDQVGNGAMKPQAPPEDKDYQFDSGLSDVKRPDSFSQGKKMNRSHTSKPKEINESKSSGSFSKSQSKVSKQARQQVLDGMEKSLGRNNKLKPLDEQLEEAIPDPDSKFYVWDMPLGDDQVRKIFDQARLPAPKKSSKQPRQNQVTSQFRQEVNNKTQENIKKKLQEKEREKKQNTIQQKVRQKKEQIVREYRKAKQIQTNPEKKEQSRKDSTQTKSKIKAKSNKELKSEFIGQMQQKPKKKLANEAQIRPHIKEAYGGIDLSDSSPDDSREYQNKATSSLQENQIFTEGDKKIFLLNSDMLAGVRHLAV